MQALWVCAIVKCMFTRGVGTCVISDDGVCVELILRFGIHEYEAICSGAGLGMY